jgi:hypothetical protein
MGGDFAALVVLRLRDNPVDYYPAGCWSSAPVLRTIERLAERERAVDARSLVDQIVISLHTTRQLAGVLAEPPLVEAMNARLVCVGVTGRDVSRATPS